MDHSTHHGKIYIPDAELPSRGGHPNQPCHESVIMLNPNGEDAGVEIAL